MSGEVVQCPLDQGRERGQTDEELAEIIQAELLGVVHRVDPAPVDDLPFAEQEADEVQAEDADGVQPALADPALVKMAQARDEPRQERGTIRIAKGNGRLAHGRNSESEQPEGRTIDSIRCITNRAPESRPGGPRRPRAVRAGLRVVTAQAEHEHVRRGDGIPRARSRPAPTRRLPVPGKPPPGARARRAGPARAGLPAEWTWRRVTARDVKRPSRQPAAASLASGKARFPNTTAA